MNSQPAVSSPAISVERVVEWVDTDASGHQHNSVIIRWVEAAEAELMRQLDVPEYFPHAPRVQHTVNFTGMLWFGQTARTDLWIDKVGNSSLTFRFEVHAQPHGDQPGGVVAHGTVTVVHVVTGHSAATPWPDDLREALETAGTSGTAGTQREDGRRISSKQT